MTCLRCLGKSKSATESFPFCMGCYQALQRPRSLKELIKVLYFTTNQIWDGVKGIGCCPLIGHYQKLHKRDSSSQLWESAVRYHKEIKAEAEELRRRDRLSADCPF